jgi:hypothetical protein
MPNTYEQMRAAPKLEREGAKERNAWPIDSEELKEIEEAVRT